MLTYTPSLVQRDQADRHQSHFMLMIFAFLVSTLNRDVQAQPTRAPQASALLERAAPASNNFRAGVKSQPRPSEAPGKAVATVPLLPSSSTSFWVLASRSQNYVAWPKVHYFSKRHYLSGTSRRRQLLRGNTEIGSCRPNTHDDP